MNIKVPGGVSRDSKYLPSLFDRQEQLEMFPWIVHLDVAVRFPWVIPLLCGVHSRVGEIWELGEGKWQTNGSYEEF